jgi:hypothetical protein
MIFPASTKGSSTASSSSSRITGVLFKSSSNERRKFERFPEEIVEQHQKQTIILSNNANVDNGACFLTKEILAKELYTKELLTKKILTKELLTKELLTKELLTKEHLTNELLTKMTF